MYAICRVKRLKNYELGKVGAHNNRTMAVPHANPDKNNTRWTKYSHGEETVCQVKSRLDEAGITKHRKDAVVAVEILMTASPEYFRPDNPNVHGEHIPQRTKDWRIRTEQFLRQKYGENLVEITLHLDEATPHIHAIVVPAVTKVKSRRRTNEQIKAGEAAVTYESATLDARNVFNKMELIKLQTEYAKSVENIGLKRGVHRSKATHNDVANFYTIANNDPQISFKPDDILDRDVFENLKIPLTGRDAFLKDLYKMVVKKVEKKVVGVLKNYIAKINFLEMQLSNEKSRANWFSSRFDSPEAVQTELINQERKIKSVCQEREEMAALLLKTKNEALRAAEGFKTKLDYIEARNSQLEAANRLLESQNKPKTLKNAPFGAVSRRSQNDLEP